MTPLSSIKGSVLEFPFKLSLFSSKNINVCVVSNYRYIIISILEILTQNGKHDENQVFLLIIGPYNYKILELKTKIPNNCAPYVFLSVLTKEVKVARINSLSCRVFQEEDATNNIFNLRKKYCEINMRLLQNIMYVSPLKSYIFGGNE